MLKSILSSKKNDKWTNEKKSAENVRRSFTDWPICWRQGKQSNEIEKSRQSLPNEAIKGPIARAKACKLRKIPKMVPFSLSKPKTKPIDQNGFVVHSEERNEPYLDAKLLITLITILEAESEKKTNEWKITLHFIPLPIENKMRPNQRKLLLWAIPKMINDGIKTKIP